jgi:hypothetical protein
MAHGKQIGLDKERALDAQQIARLERQRVISSSSDQLIKDNYI